MMFRHFSILATFVSLAIAFTPYFESASANDFDKAREIEAWMNERSVGTVDTDKINTIMITNIQHEDIYRYHIRTEFYYCGIRVSMDNYDFMRVVSAGNKITKQQASNNDSGYTITMSAIDPDRITADSRSRNYQGVTGYYLFIGCAYGKQCSSDGRDPVPFFLGYPKPGVEAEVVARGVKAYANACGSEGTPF